MSAAGFLRRGGPEGAARTGARTYGAERFDNFGDPASAPLNKPLRCEAEDNEGPYLLPMFCIRTEAGWKSAKTKTALHVRVTGWKYP